MGGDFVDAIIWNIRHKDPALGALGNINRVAMLYARSGSIIEMGYVNDDFTKNLVTIRAEERLGLGVDVPSAAYYGQFTTT